MRIYSDPTRENDKWALPDVEVFQLTAEEAAELDSDMVDEYLKRFPLATMNGRDRDRMLAVMIEEQAIAGGWFYQYGLPGCLPDSDPIGPYATHAEAIDAMREEYN